MNNKHIRFAFISIVIALFSSKAHAFPALLNIWLTDYAQETPEAGEVGCQLCHERSTGGNGWNEYGWTLRTEFLSVEGTQQQRLLSALEAIENNISIPNTDITFLDEVEIGAQPGWREGAVNTIRLRNNTISGVISPPTTFSCGALIDPGSSLDAFCGQVDDPQAGIEQGDLQIDLQTIATDLVSPILAVSEPSSPNFIYVIEQGGTVKKVNINNGEQELFLDFSNELVDSFSFDGFDERGLLGFAFDPNYQTNNRVYTYISKNADSTADFSTLDPGQSANHQTVISEWIVVNPQGNAVTGSEREMLVIDQPQFNHNGGTIVFGPDENLFISLGDGGGANDQAAGHGEDGNSRDNTNPLGAILRIDPQGTNSANGQYGIPSDNPFVGQSGLDEIYAFGFRNPYRFSIETLENNDFNLYVGDVGQGDIEEVDLISSTDSGGNYGWNFKEGSLYFFINPDGSTFVSEQPPVNEVIPPLIDPIAEYDHGEGVSVIGGHVYTGSAISALNNRYVFGEFANFNQSPTDGRLFYLNENQEIREFDYLTRPGMFITGFGEDTQNELYIVGYQSRGDTSGSLQKLVVPGQEELCFPIRAKNGQFTIVCL